MVKVLFIPGKNSRTDDFLAMLRPNRRVFYLSARSGNMVLTEDPELFVLELPADRTPCDFGAQAVVIGAGGTRFSPLPCGCVRDGAAAIFDPSDAVACSFVRTSGWRPITCGLGEKNSISLSSVGENRLVLSVGRDLTNLRGETLEVEERVFCAPVGDVGSAMLAGALLLLTEEGQDEQQ